mmetsp:Transcript_53739/g.156673  ORF Transcript_53739/g.156673 Transcript_53739/m.156673 type:complete len:224 (-) Transcript_53739:37-708(-)
MCEEGFGKNRSEGAHMCAPALWVDAVGGQSYLRTTCQGACVCGELERQVGERLIQWCREVPTAEGTNRSWSRGQQHCQCPAQCGASQPREGSVGTMLLQLVGVRLHVPPPDRRAQRDAQLRMRRELVHHVVEVRNAAGDDSWLASSNSSNVCGVSHGGRHLQEPKLRDLLLSLRAARAPRWPGRPLCPPPLLRRSPLRLEVLRRRRHLHAGGLNYRMQHQGWR